MPAPDQAHDILQNRHSSCDPTARMRFVERRAPYGGERPVRILQQMWVTTQYAGHLPLSRESEWRDIPLEKED